MVAKMNNNKIPLLILFLIYGALLFATYVSLSTLALGIWGETTVGTVNSYDSRLDDRRAGENRSRTISKGYTFRVSGKEYSGYVTYLSDEAWPRLVNGQTRSERISYLPFFPYINKPSALVEFDEMGELAIIYHILAPFAYLFLFKLVNGTVKRQKKASHRPARQPGSNQLKVRSDAKKFCTNCGSPLPTDAQFCPNCGTRTSA